MIRAVAQIQALGEIAAKMAATPFNTTLPLAITVLSELPPHSAADPLRYMLQIGNRQLETRSALPLEIGGHYWGEMDQTKEGTMLLSSLVKKPFLLVQAEEHPASFPFLESRDLTALLRESKPAEKLKLGVMEHLAAADTRQQFSLLSPLLLGFAQNVVTLFLRDSRGKGGMIQYKTARKGGKLNTFMVEFSSFLPHLGPVSGVIMQDGERLDVSLAALFSSTERYLADRAGELSGFDRVTVTRSPHVAELLPAGDTLLNLRA